MPRADIFATWFDATGQRQDEFVGSVSCPHDGWANMKKRGIDSLEVMMKAAAFIESTHATPVSQEPKP